MLTKEPEMLQPDALCEHTMQQNATRPRTPLGELIALPLWGAYSAPPDSLGGFKGAASWRGGERGRKGRGGREGRGTEFFVLRLWSCLHHWRSTSSTVGSRLPLISAQMCYYALLLLNWVISCTCKEALRQLISRRCAP